MARGPLSGHLFCCSSTVTDGRVAGCRQRGCSPCRAHRVSYRPRAAKRPPFDPLAGRETSPTPDSLVLRMPKIVSRNVGTRPLRVILRRGKPGRTLFETLITHHQSRDLTYETSKTTCRSFAEITRSSSFRGFRWLFVQFLTMSC